MCDELQQNMLMQLLQTEVPQTSEPFLKNSATWFFSFAFSTLPASSEFIASSPNSRFSVSDTNSPGSIIPYITDNELTTWCRGYMWNKITSKLFQCSLTSVWNNFNSARRNLSEIISELFQKINAAHEYFSTWTPSATEIILFQFPTWLHVK